MNRVFVVRILRIFAILEGISFLALFVTMPLKYWYELPEPNYVVGMAHGVFFIVYVALVLLVGKIVSWPIRIQTLSLIAAFLPGATFLAERKIFSKITLS